MFAPRSRGELSSSRGSVFAMRCLRRSGRGWVIRQGWGGRPVRQEQAQGIPIAALGVLAVRSGYAADAHAVHTRY
jgi:hypothetical protein